VAQALGPDDILDAFLAFRKFHDDRPRVSLDSDLPELLQHLDAALHLGGLGGLVAEALHEFLDLADLRLLQLHFLFQGLEPPLFLGQIIGVVAFVQMDAAVGKFRDLRGDLVEKKVVVRDDQDRAGIVFEIAFQPFHAFRVQMVGRFVEQHDVRPGQQNRCEQYAHFPSAGK